MMPFKAPLFGGAGNSDFSPNDLDQMLYWWEADNYTKNGSNQITAWPSSAPLPAGATNSTLTLSTATAPATLNGLDVADIALVDYFSGELIHSGSAFAQASVFKMSASSESFARLLSVTTSSPGQFDYDDAGNFRLYRSGGNIRSRPNNAGSQDWVEDTTDYHIFVTVCDGSDHYYYVDGSLVGSNAFTASLGFQKINVGRSEGFADSAHQFAGQVAEIIFCDAALSTGERQDVEGYLAERFGLTGNLPGGHPYA